MTNDPQLWQAFLSADDRSATTPDEVREVLENVFPGEGHELAIQPLSAEEQRDGLWLVQLPEWAHELAVTDEWPGVTNGMWNLEIEHP